ncbi:MAG TPA: NAD(P)/FAD-dependent oxidoreductase [Terracidiphilus sp.]|jgi:phytoene dehydrogenase-like protein|nr:NAD(P)/FAD-dependent oxidoreductase [Terracidiphilus sp.]
MAAPRERIRRAIIIGAGPNGLAAAVVLAQAGLAVEVYEAEAQPGGAARTMELTIPGFHHDFGSSVYPMGAGSPFFRTLPLAELGLEWVHGDACAAHPLDDGTAVTLERTLKDQARALAEDGVAWNELMRNAAQHWWDFADDALRPPLHIPTHPLLMARFGLHAIQPAETLVNRFRTERAKALFAGLAGHSLLAFDRAMSSAVGLIFGATALAVGWPVAKGGAQSISNALVRRLQQFNGVVHTGRRIRSLDELDTRGAITLCDVTARQLLSLAGTRLTSGYRRALERFRYGPGAFKVDYALSAPIPWKAAECGRAITVHLGGAFSEIAEAEHTVSIGKQAERPFVLVTQPSLFDPSRAPAGKHTAWAYCHVPHGASEDRSHAIEQQIERFAPGFRDCILARRVWSPADLESMDANLIGGDVNGGAFNMRQVMFRPTLRSYRTGTPGLYLCSASTPPGGGVHGMCGYNAARTALRDLRMD